MYAKLFGFMVILLALMTASCTAIGQAGAIDEKDRALFDRITNDSQARNVGAILQSCPEVVIGSREFPLAEPNYSSKRPLVFDSFENALEGFKSERAREIDALLENSTIPEIQELMENRNLSSAELVTYYVDRIKRYDLDKLNSVIELNPDAFAIAAQMDEERASGQVRGPMHGIPVLLKDNIATGDRMHTTAGTYALKDWQADRDAFLVQRLRAAGAIILGKASLSEWANYMDPCMPSGFSALGGQTRSPYGPFDPLGSSSGSAVSVASNFAAASVGSETSGSIIQPARVNSVVALRPSQGLISRDHIIPLSSDLDTPGPIGRSLTDVAIMLNVVAGVDENDSRTSDASSLAGVDFTKFLSLDEARKLRVGVIMPNAQAGQLLELKKAFAQIALGRELTEDEQTALLSEEVLPQLGGDPSVAIRALKSMGIEVVEIPDDNLTNADTASPLLSYDFQYSVKEFFKEVGSGAPISSLNDVVSINNEDPANRAPYGQRFVEWSAETNITAEEYERIHAVAKALATEWMRTLIEKNDVDVVVTGMSYSGNAGAAGVPALTIPAGLDPKGQPQGVILSGPYLSEPKLFAVGYALEQALKGRVQPDLNTTIEQIQEIQAVAGN